MSRTGADSVVEDAVHQSGYITGSISRSYVPPLRGGLFRGGGREGNSSDDIGGSGHN